MMPLPRFLVIGASLFLAACAATGPVAATLEPTRPPATATQGHLPHVDWLAYEDPSAGFSIQHPLTWQERQGTGYPVVFALQAAPGTTLLEKTMEINVTPRAADCRESTYNTETATTPPRQVLINGVNFLEERGSGIAAGNIYDWTGYSTLKGMTCITITFVLHSADPGVYSTEPPPFDRVAEAAIFDELINTFKFDQ